MARISDTARAERLPDEAFFRIGLALRPIADWSQSMPTVLDLTVSHEFYTDNFLYGPNGVQIQLARWEVGTRSISGDARLPLTSDTVVGLVPPEAERYELRYFLAGGFRLGDAVVSQDRRGQVNVTINADKDVQVEKLTSALDAIREILEEFPKTEPEDTPQPARPVTVFIGHGGSDAWEVVRDYLEVDGFNVIHFDSDERAGENTLYAIEGMLGQCDVAVVVMTGSDAMADGTMRARENVVHEVGLSQGKLGIANTFILLEDGCNEFTNIQGITQIRFKIGSIHRTKDRVLAAIARRVGTPRSVSGGFWS